jgi:hypothetical protein
MDLSKLSDEDLLAVSNGRWDSVSENGLRHLSGEKPLVLASEKSAAEKRAAMPKSLLPYMTPSLYPDAIYDPQHKEWGRPESIVKNPLMRFAIGAGTHGLGAAQLGAKAIGADNAAGFISDRVGRTQQFIDQQLQGEPDVAGFAGQVLDPIGLTVGKMIPAAAAAKRMPLLKTIGASGATGATYGATTPVTSGDNFWEQKVEQTGTGGLTGMGTGSAIYGVSAYIGRPVMEMMKGLFGENRGKLLAKDYTVQIVGRHNMDKLVDVVEKELGKQPVPGYKPTTSQIVGSRAPAEASPWLAISKSVSSSGGEVPGSGFVPSVETGRRLAEQNAALRAAMRPIAGTPDELAAANATARENAAANYGAIMPRQVSLASDVDLLGQQIAGVRGIPWQASGSGAAFSGARNMAPYTGQAGALQQAGQMETNAAQQAALANRWTPVPGLPRIPGRYSPNIEQVNPNLAGAAEARGIAAQHGKTADFLERMLDVFKDKGALTTESAAPLLQRPSMQNAMEYARRLAAEKGYKFPNSMAEDFSVQNLHDIKLGLDAQIKQGALKGNPSSLDDSTLGAISGTKSQFLQWLESKVPDYGKARVAFAKDMTPVNQMTVGQALENKLFSPLDQMTPGAFKRAIADETRTIKSATGQPRMTMEQVFNPRQMDTLNSISGAVDDRIAAARPLQPTVIRGKDVAAASTQDLLPSVLSRPVVITRWLVDKWTRSSGTLEKEIDQSLALFDQNPEMFIEAFKQVPPSTQRKIVNAIGNKAPQLLTAMNTIGSVGLLGE